MEKPLKVRYKGSYYRVALENGKVYPVIGIEGGLYRIYVDLYDDTFLFHPEQFEVVEE